jgi:hypothetical protein
VDAKWTEVSINNQGKEVPNSVPASLTAFAVDYFQVKPSATMCTISFDSNNARLSFRHISHLEVFTLKDFRAARSLASGFGIWDGPPVLSLGGDAGGRFRVTEASATFVLKITSSGVESKQLYFSDEELANRVAKAIVHAAELCGVGADQEPF